MIVCLLLVPLSFGALCFWVGRRFERTITWREMQGLEISSEPPEVEAADTWVLVDAQWILEQGQVEFIHLAPGGDKTLQRIDGTRFCGDSLQNAYARMQSKESSLRLRQLQML